jgi:hypothetical protein
VADIGSPGYPPLPDRGEKEAKPLAPMNFAIVLPLWRRWPFAGGDLAIGYSFGLPETLKINP